jgi:hypothetical protein
MKHTHLGQTSLIVSRLCYGTWQFGEDWGSFEVREAQHAIQHALELDITFSIPTRPTASANRNESWATRFGQK